MPLGKPLETETDGLVTPGYESTSEGEHKTRRRTTPIHYRSRYPTRPACHKGDEMSYQVIVAVAILAFNAFALWLIFKGHP